MNDDRRSRVLRAIVEAYVATNEPVGSKSLVEKHQLGVSSATIRNDMAALEAQGLIAQPHTSAGRVPTDKGYRAFVDNIDQVKPLSTAEKRAISQVLAQPHDIDDMLERTVRLLSGLTQQVAVIQYPVRSDEKIRHLELVDMAPGRLLVVLISDAGRVDQRMVEFGTEIAKRDLSILKRLLNAVLMDVHVDNVDAVLTHFDSPPELAVATSAIIAGIKSLAAGRKQDRVVMSGAANLAKSGPDMFGHLGPLLEAMEEQVVMLNLLSHMSAEMDRVIVSIGAENPVESFASTSVVATGYGSEDSSAKLAVVGPTRMDYPTTIAAVRAVAKYVTLILND